MAERVLSIEIGYSLTKVCEIERNGKTPKVLNTFVFVTPENTITDGIINNSEQFVMAFKNIMLQKKIKTRKAIFTVASSRIVSKEVNIPFVKESKILDVVRANLSDYFPVDPKAYVFSHSIIGLLRDQVSNPKSNDSIDALSTDSKSEELGADLKPKKKSKPVKESSLKIKATGYKLMVLAAPKQLMEGYSKLAKELGLELTDIDYNGNSVYQATKEQYNEGVQLIVKIDERSSQVMVLDNGAVSLNRTIPYGIDEAVATVQNTKELGEVSDYESAIDLIRRKTCIFGNFNGELMATDSSGSESEAVFAEKRMVTDSLRNLASGLLRVIDYYNSNHSNNTIEKAYITGIGADFSGIGTLLTNEIGLKVKNLTRLANLDVRRIFMDATFGEFVTVIGATISPVKFYPDVDETKSKNPKSTASKNSSLIAIAVLVLGLITTVVLFFVGYLPKKAELDKKASYERTIAELQPSYDIYQKYLTEQNNVQYLVNMDKATRNRNKELMAFVKYMEEKLPYSFCLNSMVADRGMVTIEGTVGSKEEVAYTLKKLKECEVFVAAEMSGVSLLENELGEVLYGFTIDLYYAPILDETQEEE